MTAPGATMSSIALRNGVMMPRIGLGLWGLRGSHAKAAIEAAINAGYRMFDTGDYYRNEADVGREIAACGLARNEVFVSSKAWLADGYDATLRAFDDSARHLGLDELDLYLIHWPRPDPRDTEGAWRALEQLLSQGRVRAIGVSNFFGEELAWLLSCASTPPAVNQIEVHPRCSQARQRAVNAAHGIVTQAWGPLGRGRGLLDSPVLAPIAVKHGRSPAQVVLRWHLQLGTTVVPKSARPQRIAENIAVFDFALDDDDLAAIAALDEDRPVGPTVQPT